MKYFLIVACVLLGIISAVWTTHLQSEFLTSIGVSPYGAFTIEPLLIIVSFLIGYTITKTHKFISAVFILILTSVSLLTILSMYVKTTYVEIQNMQINNSQVASSQKNQELIQNSLESLTKRNMSAKSTIVILDKLQNQEKAIQDKAELSDLGAVIQILSKLLITSPENAMMIFAIIMSIANVFAPSFLFYSTGILMKQMQEDSKESGVAEDVDLLPNTKLTEKQKTLKAVYENVTQDTKKIAEILGTSERIVKTQLAKIKTKQTKRIEPISEEVVSEGIVVESDIENSPTESDTTIKA